MAAKFDQAAVYQVTAICQTPLRTGGNERDPEQILRRWDGRAFLQGTSLTGAFRSWLEDREIYGVFQTDSNSNNSNKQKPSEILLGSQSQSGHLIISDALFQKDAEQHFQPPLRPRLRIDRKTGASDFQGKFDMAHLNCGTKFDFTLTWLGKTEQLPELEIVEQMLTALHTGEILLGAQKSNGFGHVSLTVKKRLFNLRNPEDRKGWLENRVNGTRLNLSENEIRRNVIIKVSGTCNNILCKAGAPSQDDTQDDTQDDKQKSQYTGNLCENGRPVLPGSSIKGAVRSRAEAIANFLKLPSAFTDALFGREAGTSDNGLAGQVFFEDVLLSENQQDRKKIKRIRMNRFTGGVIRKGLFTEEPLCSDISIKLTLPEIPAYCGLLLYALRDLGLGLYNLGSGQAIGRGYIQVQEIQATDRKGRTGTLRFQENDFIKNIELDDPNNLFGQWTQALKEVAPCEIQETVS